MFLYIYIQPMHHLMLLALAAMAAYSGMIYLAYKKNCGAVAKGLTAVLWLLWFIAVLLVTLRRGGGVRQISLIPFRSVYLGFTENVEMFRTMFMNMLLFVPGGFFGAILMVQKRRRKWMLLVLTLLSAAIECAQYAFFLGRTEVDDLICNCFGAILGCVLWNAAEKLMQRCRNI